MSGHNKWANIKHRKAAQDAKKSQVFTKLIREIIVAAREGGGDPSTNPRLRTVLEKAREANMSRDTVERSIKKGTGELEGERYEEIIYEAYAPGGVALYILTLTDNKNRTAQELRHILSKNGGSLAESGSVAWLFERKGVIEIPAEKISDMDEFMLLAIDAGAEDIEEGDPVLVYTAPESMTALRDELAKNGFEGEARMIYKPKNSVKVTGSEAEKVLKLVDALEENDDVQEVFGNFDIDDAELDAIMEKLEG
ncbi:MAG TPA: YebC/PmpR family DNA-binding transcriptional regulator [Fervidobacterium sp.]|jgi:YebC/PmpR family DNA-binding regulatory protein|nr:YebC/PmpR family DNA-binding transcriptional regulator [Fervidobacterium sp.]NLH37649.1 YebC/PmpR family DNA-binding transcriptional regulator [Thermotogaceae bacterium]MBP9518365.1 YebC/PmpR family DNA-binding transcriptional regulator [Fervidobacterium sp.]HOA16819.1 YebC/PmpR family DNA-binding transcriptional regulator [Fervidobacterium sp.]HOH52789.1 YebC/PmpR family DNA-binding transcriptional regulator [Fervidobacterium sp.]